MTVMVHGGITGNLVKGSGKKEIQEHKTVEKIYYKNLHKGKDNKSGVGSSTKSDVTCHNCGKKGHKKKEFQIQ